MNNLRWDETWHRLREWTHGQAPSERLAAQILLADGFVNLDPSHPLGGPDGGKDAVCEKAGIKWIMGVYFPRGQQPFGIIKSKYQSDLQKVRTNRAGGFVFITNQEISLSQREKLRDLSKEILVELYHLERVTTLLDTPTLSEVRKQFLGIDSSGDETAQQIKESQTQLLALQRRLESLQTGGDTFCHFMLYHFDLNGSFAQQFVIVRDGEFPLYDLQIRIMDMDKSMDVHMEDLGELNAPAIFRILRWPLRPKTSYRIFFHARNGAWHQDLILKKSEHHQCWLAATRVKGKNGRDVIFSLIDPGFEEAFGPPEWPK